MASKILKQLVDVVADISSNVVGINSLSSRIGAVEPIVTLHSAQLSSNIDLVSNVVTKTGSKYDVKTNSVTINTSGANVVLTSDASKNLLTDATGITFGDFVITKDAYGNFIFG